MNLQKIGLSVLILISSLSISFGQDKPEMVEGETWLQQYGIYYPTPTMIFRYDRYSREDTVKFREKLDLLKDAKFADEWEGSYYSGFPNQVGTFSFQWDSNAGFVDYYVYSCFPELRYLNYGKVANMPEFIQTIPEFAVDSPRNEKPVKYVKVKWGKQYYLVEESALLAFAEKAAGIYVEPEDDSSEDRQKWSNHWVKSGLMDETTGLPDLERNLPGLPEFPASYKKYQRLPIETKIISVGKRTVEENIFLGAEAAVYKVKIAAGKNKGVKVGMEFDVPDINNELVVTQVSKSDSIGMIVWSIDDNKNDKCYDDNSEKTACPQIKPALKVKTRTGKLWF